MESDSLRMRERHINKPQVLIGSVALLAGLLLYLVVRPPDAYFLSFAKAPDALSYEIPSFFKAIAGPLPSFLHVLAFSLLLGGLLACRKTGYLIICSAWLFINVLFELGQRHSVSASQLMPEWFGGLFVLGNMRSYFLNGTFDFFDLMASSAGAVAAYCILTMTLQDRRK